MLYTIIYLFISFIYLFLGDLVELLWILMQKNKIVMLLSHVPVYLAAYNATLSEADQFILLVRIINRKFILILKKKY